MSEVTYVHMIQLKDILDVDNGARFVNADLHVHSFGASKDVQDPSMTPQAIVDAAVQQNLGLLAITDHNSDKNLASALDYANKHTGLLLVLPGVEVTTAHGHLLVYFAPEKASYVGKLLTKIDLVGEMGDQDAHTAKSMADVIREAELLGGVCIAAHVDRAKTGFDTVVEGFPNWKKDIILSSGLYGLEFDKAEHMAWYSSDDEPTPQGLERKKLLQARGKVSAAFGRVNLAAVQGSDAHSMSVFTNRSPSRPWTRFKLNELSFDAFRTALIDAEARVRAVAQIPRSFPRIRGMHCAGGFLNGEKFHFSDNLNCFIGGRGTGKSSAIRGLAYCLGAHERFGDFENCPDTVTVWCEDADGILYRYDRTRNGNVVVRAKENGEVTDVPADAFRIEYYGQGELAEVAKDPLSNSAMFQDFLDRHIVLRDLAEREEALVNRLQENGGQLIPLEAAFAQLPVKNSSLLAVNKKLKIAEEGKLRDIVGAQTRVSSEKTLRQSLEAVRSDYANGLSLSILERDFDQLSSIAGEVTGDAVSKPLIKSLADKIGQVNKYLADKAGEINAYLKAASQDLKEFLDKLKANHNRMDGELATKITELKGQGLTGNIAELQLLLRQKETLSSEITQVEQKRKQLEKLRSNRIDLMKELAEVRAAMTTRRKQQLALVNSNLTKTITDYLVFVKYEPAGIIDAFFKKVTEVMHGSYFNDQHCRSLCQKVSPQALATLVRNRDVSGIARAAGISADWAQHVQGRFCKWEVLFELEVMAKQPSPVINVRTKGNPPRDIVVTQLSDGQRHTILLTIAMLAESNLPLVIDQPEDDLDSGFITSSIVATLRAIKERRQVILVTHNPNIAVLGDSELLFPMQRQDDNGKAVSRGSIDKTETKEAAQRILEGGELAFRRRQAIYGY